MKSWNKLSRTSLVALALVVVAALCARTASAQYVTLLNTQTFQSWPPSGWNGTFSCNTCGAWYYSANGNGTTNSSAVCDIWDYSTQPLSPPSMNVSSYANRTDSIWVDFDFCWEYSGISNEYPDDHFQLYANNDMLLNLATSTDYTYYNSSDTYYTVDPPTAAADWRHYHILIPTADRTSALTISWVGAAAQGITNPAIDNVTITGFFVAPSELSLTPNPKNLNFGTATPNSPDTIYVTAKSVGATGTTLHIIGTSMTGSSSYSIISGPANGTGVPLGSSVQYGIRFLPFTSGTLTGTFSVITDGADSGTQTMNLTGVGAVPNVTYNGVSTLFRGVRTPIPDTSVMQYIPVTSNGVGPLSFTSFKFYGLNANNYYVSRMPQNPLPTGVTDSIGVRFTPTIEGQPDARLVITTTAANIPLDTIGLFGVGVLPHLAINNTYPTPFTVNLDSVSLGSDSCVQLVLTNPGSDTLAILRNYLESKDFDYSYTPLTGIDTLIPPGGEKTVQLCFAPIHEGTRVATLRIMTNIPHTETIPQHDTSQFVVNFVGVGVPTFGKLVVTGTTAYDSVAIGDTECFMDTIWNKGGASITITSVVAATDATPLAFFASGYPTVPFVLAPYSYQTVLVCAEPITTFATGGLFWATATGGGVDSQQYAPLELSITVTKTAASASVVVPFSTQVCMGDSETASVIVHNTGTLSDVYTAAITGVNATDFNITSQNPSPSIPGLGSNVFLIQFKPSASGPESAVLHITRGINEEVPGGPITLTSSGGASIIAGSGTAPTSSVGSTLIPFSATVNNTGTCSWTPGDVSVNAPFAYVSGGTTAIAPSGNGTLNFTMDPSVAGNYSSPVTFSNSTGVSIPAANVNVSGSVGAAGVQMVSAANGYSLDQNYPNPFGTESNLEITLPVGGMVHMTLINVQGETVQTVLNQHFDAGTFEIKLDASALMSGTYYYQMQAGGVTLTRQMVVVK